MLPHKAVDYVVPSLSGFNVSRVDAIGVADALFLLPVLVARARVQPANARCSRVVVCSPQLTPYVAHNTPKVSRADPSLAAAAEVVEGERS